MNNLGKIYENGEGVEQNYPKAFRKLNFLYEQDESKAYECLQQSLKKSRKISYTIIVFENLCKYKDKSFNYKIIYIIQDLPIKK